MTVSASVARPPLARIAVAVDSTFIRVIVVPLSSCGIEAGGAMVSAATSSFAASRMVEDEEVLAGATEAGFGALINSRSRTKPRLSTEARTGLPTGGTRRFPLAKRLQLSQ